jgi:hypothetical protein
MPKESKVDVNAVVKQYASENEVTQDQAKAALLAIGAGRYAAASKYNAKLVQARKFTAGEVKTAPKFEPRKNLHPKLVAAKDAKTSKPKSPKAQKKAEKDALLE